MLALGVGRSSRQSVVAAVRTAWTQALSIFWGFLLVVVVIRGARGRRPAPPAGTPSRMAATARADAAGRR